MQTTTGKHPTAQTAETTPTRPNLCRRPLFNFNALSTSPSGIPSCSRITSACRIIRGSRYSRPTAARLGFPTDSASISAARAARCRALHTRSAGFASACAGNTVPVRSCVLLFGVRWLKVLELDNVGFGVTGPMERSEAAKVGSRASISMALSKKVSTSKENKKKKKKKKKKRRLSLYTRCSLQ